MVSPILRIPVGRLGGLAAAKLLLGLGILFFGPLEHLDPANQTHTVAPHAELGVERRACGGEHARDVDQPAFVGRVDAVGRHGVHQPGAFGERPCGRDRTAFVPEKEDAGHGDQREAEQHTGEGLPDTLQPGSLGDFSDRVRPAFRRHLEDPDYGTRMVWPVVLRLSRSIWACAASASG